MEELVDHVQLAKAGRGDRLDDVTIVACQRPDLEAGDTGQLLEQHRRRPGDAPLDGLVVADGQVMEVGQALWGQRVPEFAGRQDWVTERTEACPGCDAHIVTEDHQLGDRTGGAGTGRADPERHCDR